MNKETKILLAIAAVVAIVVSLLIVLSPDKQTTSNQSQSQVDTSALVREDSHKLSTAPDGKVTVVEFLDFECEACKAAFPTVEQLRAEYGNRVTFVARYFPIQSHKNAQLAAQSVEAAAEQGKFEDMYKKMYENQQTWSERQTSQEVVFDRFATELGLDMNKFNATQQSEQAKNRVDKDQADGEKVGVQGTPSFYVNGRFVQSVSQLRAAIEAELKK